MEVFDRMSKIKEAINKLPREYHNCKYMISYDDTIKILEGKKIEDEKVYCDRNLCFSMEINGLGCEECPVTKQDN